MGATKEQLHAKAIKDLHTFIVKNHNVKMDQESYMFDIYPVCIQDICIDALVADKDGKVHLVDTDKNHKIIKYRRDANEVSTKHLKIALDDLKELQKKRK